MLLSSADKKAAHDGFKFLVLSPTGQRKCYCTSVKEAKREAGKGGKIVSLGRMRYTTQNPRKRNPSARMVGLQRNPSFPVSSPPVSKLVKELGITVEEAKHIKALASQGKPKTALKYANDAISRAHGVESLYPEFPHFYYVNMGDTYDTTLYYDGKALRIGDWGSYVERHERRRNPSARMVGLQRNPKGKGMVPFSELAVGDRFKFGGDKCKKISKTKFQIEASGPFPATTVAAQPWYNVEPLSKRNPTWLTTGLLAGAAYVYGRSAKVREKVKGAFDRVHAKLENPRRKRRNPAAKPRIDEAAARELALYTENDYHLATRRMPEFAKNLATKIKRGKYDAAKAVKLLEYLTKEAATKYAKEFGGRWDTTFSPATRRAAAEILLPSVVELAAEY